jgi:hypothetical protein
MSPAAANVQVEASHCHLQAAPMRTAIRFVIMLATAILTLLAGQAVASAATAIEYGLM